MKIAPLFHKVMSNILTFIALKRIQSIAYSSHRNILRMEKMVTPIWSFIFQISMPLFGKYPHFIHWV